MKMATLLQGHQSIMLFMTAFMRNTKDPKDVLRKVELVPELGGWANSQCAEQLFSGLRKNNHFLDMMSLSSHIFLMKNILHHYNNGCNAKTEHEENIGECTANPVELQWADGFRYVRAQYSCDIRISNWYCLVKPSPAIKRLY